MIEVVDLKKAYGDVQALGGVSFNIAEGEIVGLLGPNGAGKTTIIKTLTGYLQPDEGDVTVDGLDVVGETKAVQSRIGYLPESAPLYPELSVQRYLQMMAGMREIDPDEQIDHIRTATLSTGLQHHLTRPISQLSKGFRQRVGLAQAILHQPRLLILDEPTVGLDPTQIVEIRNLIRRLSQNSTILFSTHILPEVEALCDRVIILMNGEIKIDARLSDLAKTNNAILILDGVEGDDATNVMSGLEAIEGINTVAHERDNGHTTFRVNGDDTIDLTPALYHIAASNNWPVRELRPDVQTLESIFNQLAG